MYCIVFRNSGMYCIVLYLEIHVFEIYIFQIQYNTIYVFKYNTCICIFLSLLWLKPSLFKNNNIFI